MSETEQTEEKKKPDSRHLARLLGMAMNAFAHLRREPGHTRSGITKNHGKPRSKARAKMSRDSRRINRGR